MDAIEYSVKQASLFAANGNAKNTTANVYQEAYDMFLANLGKLCGDERKWCDEYLISKAHNSFVPTGAVRDGEDALYRMIPLCRTCVSAIEKILDAGLVMSSAKFISRPPLTKERRVSSLPVDHSSDLHLAMSPQASLFSAVLDSFPSDFRINPNSTGVGGSLCTPANVPAPRISQSMDSYQVLESPGFSLRESIDMSVNDDSQIRFSLNAESTRSRENSSARTTETSPHIDAKEILHPLIGKSGAKTTVPEIPTSPLSTTYVTLSQKLSVLTSPQSSPDIDQFVTTQDTLPSPSSNSESTSLDEEEANEIRTQISKVLHQIQVLSFNPTVSIYCFRPIAIAYQLCVIEHNLLRQIHSNDVLVHKNPHPAPSLQACADFFNYFTRLVECSILQHQNLADRVKTITRWFKTAGFLKRFNNFQSLKALTGALNTPPIIRLKKTWSQIKRKNAVELAEFEELADLVSEQNNHSLYRNYIKNNQTRPIVPYLGVITHDMSYLIAAAKNTNQSLVSDKRVQEIQKFVRYCCLGPRYSYEMLVDLDSSMYTSSVVPTTKKSRRKVKGGGLSDIGVEVLGTTFKEASEVEIGAFIAHWLLSRKYVSEKEVDEMSLAREPKVGNGATKVSSTGNANEHAFTLNEEIVSIGTQSKTEDMTDSKTESTSSFLKAKDNSSAAPLSPGLTKGKMGGSTASFMETLRETAYTLVSKQSKTDKSGSGTPAVSNSPGKKAASGIAKPLNDIVPRGRQLESLLRRRQRSVSNLDADTVIGANKSVSMDAGLNSRTTNMLDAQSFSKDVEKASSYGSVGSIHHSYAIGIAEEPASVRNEDFNGVESEELKRKLELLEIQEDSQLRGTSSSCTTPLGKIRDNHQSGSSGNYRHNFFTSFFAHTENNEGQVVMPNDGLVSLSSESSRQILFSKQEASSKLDSCSNKQYADETSSAKSGFFSSTKNSQQIESIASEQASSLSVHQPEGKEKQKSRRRASSAGVADAGKNFTSESNATNEISLLNQDPPQQSIHGEQSGAIKQIKKLNKRLSEKAIDLSNQPSPISNTAALLWGNKHSKSPKSQSLVPITDATIDIESKSRKTSDEKGPKFMNQKHQQLKTAPMSLNLSHEPKTALPALRKSNLASTIPPVIPPKPAELSRTKLGTSTANSSTISLHTMSEEQLK
ncbi:RasGEF [Physocladia obscura]|uniref:RasGEF n=1 Tax=Physocladia obscura TaxID=109957 RepID=A0AAD5TCK7_9FUNG|nr:RasGEF [Physocladia obscura]